MLLKFHQALARALVDNGVHTVFGLIGDANMFMIDSFVADCGGNFIAAAHEVGSALMALGYASLSGKIGVCSVTHGPAMSNTVTALIEGVKGQLPLVLLCGDTAVVEREYNQNIPQRDLVIATGAGFEQLRSPETLAEDFARTIRRAITEYRPIVLNIPYEFDWKDVDYEPLRVRIPESRAIVAASDDLDSAIGIIAAARRPVILAGRGAASAEAKAAILKLAKRIEAPLTTTLKAKDLFQGEDYDLGICGTVSSAVTVETIMESDCLIAFGASLNYRTTSHGAFVKGKRVVQINLEPSEIGKNITPTVGMVGDPAGVADLFVHWLDEAEIPASGWYGEELKQKIASELPELDPDAAYADGTVNYRRALLQLDAALPDDRVLVTDGGRFMRHAWTLLRTSGLNSFVVPCNTGSIGLGLSHAIGASCAAGERATVLVTGDGGFMHGGLTEFNTAVRHKRDLIVIVCNDSAYGAEVQKFGRKYTDRVMPAGLIEFDWPDFAPVAIALGGSGITVRTEEDLQQAEALIRDRTSPVLIDLKVDPHRMPIV